MNTKKRVITSLIIIVILAGLITGTVFLLRSGTIDKVFADVKVYTVDDLKKAQEFGYNESLKEILTLKAEVEYLKETLAGFEEDANNRFNAMVDYYENEIKKLQAELDGQAAFIQKLRNYIIDTTIDTGGSSTTIDARLKQLEVFKGIKQSIEIEISDANKMLSKIPDLTALRSEIDNQIVSKVVSEREYKENLDLWNATDYLTCIFIPDKDSFNSGLQFLYNRNISQRDCIKYGYEMWCKTEFEVDEKAPERVSKIFYGGKYYDKNVLSRGTFYSVYYDYKWDYENEMELFICTYLNDFLIDTKFIEMFPSSPISHMWYKFEKNQEAYKEAWLAAKKTYDTAVVEIPQKESIYNSHFESKSKAEYILSVNTISLEKCNEQIKIIEIFIAEMEAKQ